MCVIGNVNIYYIPYDKTSYDDSQLHRYKITRKL